MEKLISIAAITGNITLPAIPQQAIDDAIWAGDAGATCVQIHGRDSRTAKTTTEPAVYREIAAGTKAEVMPLFV